MIKLSNLVSLYAFGVISSSAMDAKDLKAINGISVESDNEEITSIRKGAWSSQEDSILTNYISIHGEGRWNHLACNSGLKRTGKSCRLRWKNYLQPNVRRGNFTLEEQLRIIELHCLFGNRWSKMAEFLPGRTDNEIKNYWRTRVQKQAKQLKYDINSTEFREFIRNVWLPRLSLQIHASKCDSNLVDVIMNSDVVETINGPEPLQMDYWTSLSRTRLSDVVDAHQVSIMNDLSELDFGQGYPFMGYGVDGIDNPAWFNSVEFSDMLQTDDIYF